MKFLRPLGVRQAARRQLLSMGSRALRRRRRRGV